MVKIRGQNSNGKTVKQTVKYGRKISGDDAARPAWVMVPGVSSSRLCPDSDQSRIWCRARPWLGCDSLNELTWVSFVVHVHWHPTIFFFFFLWLLECCLTRQWQSTECDTKYMVQRKKFDVILRLLDDIGERSHPNPMHRSSLFQRDFQTGNRFGWSFFFAVWRRCARSQLHMNSVVLVESQGSCALVRIARLQKFDRRDNMIFTVHPNRLIDENTPLEQSTIETCLQEAYKYQKVTKISCDTQAWSRFEASWLDCVTMMSEMTIAVIFVSASCHHLTRADSGWSRISWFSRVTLPWLRGGTSVAPWRHKCSHVPVFRRLFDRLPVRISTSDLHHRILRKKLYHIRAYDFGVQFSFKTTIDNLHGQWFSATREVDWDHVRLTALVSVHQFWLSVQASWLQELKMKLVLKNRGWKCVHWTWRQALDVM